MCIPFNGSRYGMGLIIDPLIPPHSLEELYSGSSCFLPLKIEVRHRTLRRRLIPIPSAIESMWAVYKSHAATEPMLFSMSHHMEVDVPAQHFILWHSRVLGGTVHTNNVFSVRFEFKAELISTTPHL